MPTKTIGVKPGTFLRRGGVVVYYTYKDDDVDQGEETFYFTTNPDGSYDGETDQFYFDARELPTWKAPEHPPFLSAPGGSSPEEYDAYKAKHDTPENRAAWDKWHADGVERKAIRAAIHAAIKRGIVTKEGVRPPPKPSGLPLPSLPLPEAGPAP